MLGSPAVRAPNNSPREKKQDFSRIVPQSNSPTQLSQLAKSEFRSNSSSSHLLQQNSNFPSLQKTGSPSQRSVNSPLQKKDSASKDVFEEPHYKSQRHSSKASADRNKRKTAVTSPTSSLNDSLKRELRPAEKIFGRQASDLRSGLRSLNKASSKPSDSSLNRESHGEAFDRLSRSDYSRIERRSGSGDSPVFQTTSVSVPDHIRQRFSGSSQSSGCGVSCGLTNDRVGSGRTHGLANGRTKDLSSDLSPARRTIRQFATGTQVKADIEGTLEKTRNPSPERLQKIAAAVRRKVTSKLDSEEIRAYHRLQTFVCQRSWAEGYPIPLWCIYSPVLHHRTDTKLAAESRASAFTRSTEIKNNNMGCCVSTKKAAIYESGNDNTKAFQPRELTPEGFAGSSNFEESVDFKAKESSSSESKNADVLNDLGSRSVSSANGVSVVQEKDRITLTGAIAAGTAAIMDNDFSRQQSGDGSAKSLGDYNGENSRSIGGENSTGLNSTELQRKQQASIEYGPTVSQTIGSNGVDESTNFGGSLDLKGSGAGRTNDDNSDQKEGERKSSLTASPTGGVRGGVDPVTGLSRTGEVRELGERKKKAKKSTVLEQKLREQYTQIRDIPFWRPKTLQSGQKKDGKANHVIGLTLSRRQLNKFYKWQPVGGSKADKDIEAEKLELSQVGIDQNNDAAVDNVHATGAGSDIVSKKRSSTLSLISGKKKDPSTARTDHYGFLLRKPLSSRRVKQGAVGDCSFLAILNCLVDFDATFCNNFEASPNNRGALGSSENAFLRSLFVAFIPEKNVILVKLYVDCQYRMVPVTPTVPISREGKILCAHSTNPNEVWICLLEKAYVTIAGGNYDFFGKGSNPNTDGYHLTGWVPETLPINFLMQQISIGQYDQDALKIWNAMHHGMKSGRCVVCLGTGRIKDAVVERGSEDPEGVSVKYGIVQNHAYSVLKTHIIEPTSPGGERIRLLYLKNPWGRCSWKGAFGPKDTAWDVYDNEFKKHGLPGASNNQDDGYFWMQWRDVLNTGTFSHIYILWNKDRLIRKKRFDNLTYETGYDDACNCLGASPQFLLNAKRGKKYYFVVSRVKNTTLSSSYIAAHAYKMKSPKPVGWMSNYVSSLSYLKGGTSKHHTRQNGSRRHSSGIHQAGDRKSRREHQHNTALNLSGSSSNYVFNNSHMTNAHVNNSDASSSSSSGHKKRKCDYTSDPAFVSLDESVSLAASSQHDGEHNCAQSTSSSDNARSGSRSASKSFSDCAGRGDMDVDVYGDRYDGYEEGNDYNNNYGDNHNLRDDFQLDFEEESSETVSNYSYVEGRHMGILPKNGQNATGSSSSNVVHSNSASSSNIVAQGATLGGSSSSGKTHKKAQMIEQYTQLNSKANSKIFHEPAAPVNAFAENFAVDKDVVAKDVFNAPPGMGAGLMEIFGLNDSEPNSPVKPYKTNNTGAGPVSITTALGNSIGTNGMEGAAMPSNQDYGNFTNSGGFVNAMNSALASSLQATAMNQAIASHTGSSSVPITGNNSGVSLQGVIPSTRTIDVGSNQASGSANSQGNQNPGMQLSTHVDGAHRKTSATSPNDDSAWTIVSSQNSRDQMASAQQQHHNQQVAGSHNTCAVDHRKDHPVDGIGMDMSGMPCHDNRESPLTPFKVSWNDRLWCPSNEHVMYYPGVYTNGECCLMKIQYTGNDDEAMSHNQFKTIKTGSADVLEYDQYILLLSQHDSSEKFHFSVELFVEDDDDNDDVDFDMIPYVPRAHYQRLNKQLWPLDCGCMNDKGRYVNNPCFLIEAETKSDMMIVLCSLTNSLNIRIWEENQNTEFLFRELVDFHAARSKAIMQGKCQLRNVKPMSGASLDILSETCIGNSGPYRHNCCTHVMRSMKPGVRYLVIVSTFHCLQSDSQCEYDLEFIVTKSKSVSIKQLSGGPASPKASHKALQG